MNCERCASGRVVSRMEKQSEKVCISAVTALMRNILVMLIGRNDTCSAS